MIYLQVRGSPFAADKRRGFRLWRQRARRRAQQKSEGSANENGTNDENEDDQKVCVELILIIIIAKFGLIIDFHFDE